MSLSRGLVIKSGRAYLPQWRFRPLASEGVVGWAINTWYTALEAGDAAVRYVTITKVGGANQTAEVNVVVDGQDMTVTQVCVPGTVYYIYLDSVSDTLVATAAVTRFGNGDDWFANSVFIRGRQTTSAPLTGFDLLVRYWSL